MLNVSILQGRLTADPVLKSTPSGVSVVSFRLASDSDYKAQDGSRHANFIDCVAWRKTAEAIAQYCGKGRMIVVKGELTSRNYTDKNGNNRTAIEIVVDSFYFCDSKKDGQSNSQQAPSTDGFMPVDEDGFAAIDDEDLPF